MHHKFSVAVAGRCRSYIPRAFSVWVYVDTISSTRNDVFFNWAQEGYLNTTVDWSQHATAPNFNLNKCDSARVVIECYADPCPLSYKVDH